MEFRTIVKPEESELKISHNDPILLLGSCFADNMGRRLQRELFDAVSNPLGALYNPLSIQRAVERLVFGKTFSEPDIFFHQDQYHSFDCHSKHSASEPQELITSLNRIVALGHEQLINSSTIFLTFGSTKVFEREGRVVANCHKLPASEFSQRFLTLQETTEAIQNTIDAIKGANPTAQIILNISPVRHLAYGAHNNQLSKATLLLAVEMCVNRNERVHYFPSYEILLDDLRDYRFYDRDMCHPSESAADYIYEALAGSYFTEQTKAIAERCRRFTALREHRPLSDNPKALETLRNSISNQRYSLLTDYPFLEKALNRL